MAADDARRRRHDRRMTFVRVATIDVNAIDAATMTWPDTAGEVRLVGTPADWTGGDRRRARARGAGGGSRPVTGFSLADLESAGSGRGGATEGRRAHRGRRRADRPAGDRRVGRVDGERGRAGGASPDGGAAPASARRRCSTVPRCADGTGWRSIQAFAPLPRRLAGDAPSTGYEDVRMVALARLLVDVPHVQVDWSLYGPKLAQVALTFGADDVDGVLAGGRHERGAPPRAARRDSAEHRRGLGRARRARRPLRAARLMAPVRIGAVSYLNARPLVDGLDRWPDRFDVRYDLPSTCATLLHHGDIDLGLIPSIEYLRGDGYAHRPRLRHRVGRPRSLGRDLHVGADRARAHHRARHELADLGGADARDGRAAFRHHARVRRPSARSRGHAHARGRGAAHRRSGAVCRLRRASGCRRSISARSGRTFTGLPFVYACWTGRPGAVDAATRGDAAGRPRARRDRRGRCGIAILPGRPRQGCRRAPATCARTSGSASATASAPASSDSSRWPSKSASSSACSPCAGSRHAERMRYTASGSRG